ncbi:MAG: oligopeptide transporter permease protein [Symbiobacteriaceae bacterium]|jgi:ABC-type dipeptide/oligopeptide/nickel transport system permease component|nr:oligopeptide transporter permease protein [Symbiobacteriaceae bacterium]
MQRMRTVLRLWVTRLLLLIVSAVLLVGVTMLSKGWVYKLKPPTQFQIVSTEIESVHYDVGQYGAALQKYWADLRAGTLLLTPRTVAGASSLLMNPRNRLPLFEVLRPAWTNSLMLYCASVGAGLGAGVLLGSLVTLRRRFWKSLSMGFSVLGLALPDFGLVLGGQFLTLWASRTMGLKLWPILAAPETERGWLLPLLVLSLPPAAYAARLTAGALDEIMREDYIRTARSKGLHEARVIVGHAMRNALPRILSGLPVMLGVVLSSLPVVELITNWPGLSKWMVGVSEESTATVAVIFLAWGVLMDALAGSLHAAVALPGEEVSP